MPLADAKGQRWLGRRNLRVKGSDSRLEGSPDQLPRQRRPFMPGSKVSVVGDDGPPGPGTLRFVPLPQWNFCDASGDTSDEIRLEFHNSL